MCSQAITRYGITLTESRVNRQQLMLEIFLGLSVRICCSFGWVTDDPVGDERYIELCHSFQIATVADSTLRWVDPDLFNHIFPG